MTLNTSELLSIHEKHPNDIFSLKAKFDFDTKEMLILTAELNLGGLYFSPVNVELPTNKAEKKALANKFFYEYRNCSREEMPENGILVYKNYPNPRYTVTRPTMYISL